ncbi:MAG: sigma 54-interacting transcriptional regulator [Syntrophaceticus sp.]|nr:sigma 54-interacting transcriptional regulator [Syntrophaceticus sp.]MDD4360311.1 sigma 54-interacting transcriptional regulator [Syntrophaceticus sp.]
MQEKQEQRTALLDKVLNTISEGVIVTDAEGEIIFFNEALENMEGLKSSEVVGRYLSDIYRVTPGKSDHSLVIKSGKPYQEQTITYFTAEGDEINLMASYYPVEHRGEVIGAFSVCRDFTRIKDLITKNMNLQRQVHAKEGNDKPLHNGTRYRLDDFIYAGEQIDMLINQAQKAALTDFPVLVYGETGTGKEVLAQGIHNASARREEPFVGINCAAIPETLLESTLFGTVKGAFTGAVDSQGLFQQAGKGTLFLDEINSMPATLQAKLLRVLQERSYRRVGSTRELPLECRIVTSTNVDPYECIEKGTLREDIFYRFAVFTLFIPPLRERIKDIEELITHFIKNFCRVYGQVSVKLDPELKQALLSYDWPGNVRELQHVIESSLVMLNPDDKELTFEHLPSYIRPKFKQQTSHYVKYTAEGNSLNQVLRNTEKQVIEEALRSHRGNITRAAKSLGILRQNLQYRMRKLGVKAE